MKFLLIDPPFQKFMDFSKRMVPLGLLSLAATLKREGHEVTVFDADYHPTGKSFEFHEKMQHYDAYLNGLQDLQHPLWEASRRVIRTERPDVVGISIISTKLPSAERVADVARQEGVGIIAAGGPHASIKPEEVWNRGHFDYVFTGEAEDAIPKILDLPKGIIVGERIKNLDALPWPDRRTLKGLEDYDPKDLGMVMTTRGCPNDCNFCNSGMLWGRKVRSRSIDNVLGEVKHLKSDLGVTDFYLVDDTFTYKSERVAEFCEGVTDQGITWSCLARANTITSELARRMKLSGCTSVKLGVESGSEYVLGLMNKNQKKVDVLNASEAFRQAGLPWVAYIMVGVPGEKPEHVDETIQFIREARPDFVSVSNFTPYPGTKFYDQIGANGEYHLHNHHRAESHGEVTREKVLEVARFVDQYNKESNARKK